MALRMGKVPPQEPTLSRSLAAAGAAAVLGLAFAASVPALADLPARKLKPTLPATSDSADRDAGAIRGHDSGEGASATQGRVVSFATRDLEIGKLDANAFGDGEDVTR